MQALARMAAKIVLHDSFVLQNHLFRAREHQSFNKHIQSSGQMIMMHHEGSQVRGSKYDGLGEKHVTLSYSKAKT